MDKKIATRSGVASSCDNVINLEAILKNRRLERKPCCRVPVHFACECEQFFAIRQRVRAIRRALAGGGTC